MPPAYITVKTDGWRTGTREVLEKLFDPDQADTVDPRTYLFRLYIRLETGDQRYLHVNTGMWIGSGMRRGAEGRNRTDGRLRKMQKLTVDSYIRRLSGDLNCLRTRRRTSSREEAVRGVISLADLCRMLDLPERFVACRSSATGQTSYTLLAMLL